MYIRILYFLFYFITLALQCAVCTGTTGKGDYMGYVHIDNIGNFTNCTAIEGGLDFINKTFQG